MVFSANEDVMLTVTMKNHHPNNVTQFRNTIIPIIEMCEYMFHQQSFTIHPELTENLRLHYHIVGVVKSVYKVNKILNILRRDYGHCHILKIRNAQAMWEYVRKDQQGMAEILKKVIKSIPIYGKEDIQPIPQQFYTWDDYDIVATQSPLVRRIKDS